jgi:hypothetical protein
MAGRQRPVSNVRLSCDREFLRKYDVKYDERYVWD